jgi:hypothetical protein
MRLFSRISLDKEARRNGWLSLLALIICIVCSNWGTSGSLHGSTAGAFLQIAAGVSFLLALVGLALVHKSAATSPILPPMKWWRVATTVVVFSALAAIMLWWWAQRY